MRILQVIVTSPFAHPMEVLVNGQMQPHVVQVLVPARHSPRTLS